MDSKLGQWFRPISQLPAKARIAFNILTQYFWWTIAILAGSYRGQWKPHAEFMFKSSELYHT